MFPFGSTTQRLWLQLVWTNNSTAGVGYVPSSCLVVTAPAHSMLSLVNKQMNWHCACPCPGGWPGPEQNWCALGFCISVCFGGRKVRRGKEKEGGRREETDPRLFLCCPVRLLTRVLLIETFYPGLFALIWVSGDPTLSDFILGWDT